MEVSSHAIDQQRIDGIRYRAMAFTNLAPDHLDYHGSMENYYATKASMFDAERTDLAVVNIADEYGRRLAATAGAEVWTCSSTITPQTYMQTASSATRRDHGSTSTAPWAVQRCVCTRWAHSRWTTHYWP